ncbi:hypothetical protein E2320_005654, partial [Naja naja]
MAEGGSLCCRRHRPWKRHIVRQLQQRDRAQKARFLDLVQAYTMLLEKCNWDDLSMAYKVYELNQLLQAKDAALGDQKGSGQLLALQGRRCHLQSQVEELGCRNSARKDEYDSQQRHFQQQDRAFRQAQENGERLLRQGEAKTTHQGTSSGHQVRTASKD